MIGSMAPASRVSRYALLCPTHASTAGNPRSRCSRLFTPDGSRWQLLGMEGGQSPSGRGSTVGAIARKAIDRKTGARGPRPIMEAILLDSMFDLPSLEGVKEVMISQQVVEGTPGPLYGRGKQAI
jgi:hypothetical protein